MVILKGAGLAAIVLSLFAARTNCVTPLSTWTQGIATNYGGAQDGLQPDQPSFGTQDGSCGYGLLSKGDWPYWSVAGISTSNKYFIQGPLEACGMCFEIQCLNNAGQFAGRCNTANPVSAIVQITDKCPECLENHFDMQALTFNKIAPMANGRIDIQYRRVECVPPSQMVVFVDNNNGPGGWLRMFIEQSGGQAAISQVQIRTTNSGQPWVSMNNVYGGDWEIGATPNYPLDISIIGPDGQTVTAFGVINNKGQIGDFPTNAQFHITNPTDNLLTQPITAGSSRDSPIPSPPAGNTPSSSASATTSIPTATTTNSPPTPSGVPPVPPPPSPTPSSPLSASSSNATSPPAQTCSTCTDIAPPVWSCAQQVSWGQCGQTWMLAGDPNAPKGWCAISCGRCSC